MKSILDPAFKYVPSHETNIRKLFDRVRWEQRKAREFESAKVTRVVPIIREAKA